MPNWCECDLRIEGPTAKVEEFLEFAKGEESCLDFSRFIPYPEHFAELDRAAAEWAERNPPPWSEEAFKTRPTDGYNQGGCEWCVRNWGTKWNACRVSTSPNLFDWCDEGGRLALVEINFSTA